MAVATAAKAEARAVEVKAVVRVKETKVVVEAVAKVEGVTEAAREGASGARRVGVVASERGLAAG